jgi:hypothetical protein
MPQTAVQTEPPRPTAGFARGGHVNPSARRKNDSAAGSSGKVKSERALPKGHTAVPDEPRASSDYDRIIAEAGSQQLSVRVLDEFRASGAASAGPSLDRFRRLVVAMRFHETVTIPSDFGCRPSSNPHLPRSISCLRCCRSLCLQRTDQRRCACGPYPQSLRCTSNQPPSGRRATLLPAMRLLVARATGMTLTAPQGGVSLVGWTICGRLVTGGGGRTATGGADGDALGVNVPGAK